MNDLEYQKKAKERDTRTRKQKLKDFVQQVALHRTVNLPKTAQECGLEWEPIQEEIKEKGWLYEELDKVLVRLKFYILETVNAVALHGRREGASASLGHLRFMIEMIDNGTILGVPKQEEEDTTPDDLDDEDLRRLGLT